MLRSPAQIIGGQVLTSTVNNANTLNHSGGSGGGGGGGSGGVGGVVLGGGNLNTGNVHHHSAPPSPQPSAARTSLFDSCHRKIRLIGGGPVAFLGGLVAKARRKERDGDHTADTKLYLEEGVLERKLPDADLRALVDLPSGLDYNEWLASHTLALFEHTNLVYGTISEFCTTSGCPDMTGPGTRVYLWFDEKGKKSRVAAPQYIDFVMTYTQKTVTDELIFPTKYANEFPLTFESTAKKILRLLFHVIAHLYAAHFREIALLGLHTHINLTFAHLMTLHKRFNLMEPKETEVLRDLEVALRLTGEQDNTTSATTTTTTTTTTNATTTAANASPTMSATKELSLSASNSSSTSTSASVSTTIIKILSNTVDIQATTAATTSTTTTTNTANNILNNNNSNNNNSSIAAVATAAAARSTSPAIFTNDNLITSVALIDGDMWTEPIVTQPEAGHSDLNHHNHHNHHHHHLRNANQHLNNYHHPQQQTKYDFKRSSPPLPATNTTATATTTAVFHAATPPPQQRQTFVNVSTNSASPTSTA